MAKYDKVVFEYPVKEIHGKPCSHTDVYFGTNGFTHKPYISRLCHPSKVVTAGMLAQRIRGLLLLLHNRQNYINLWVV